VHQINGFLSVDRSSITNSAHKSCPSCLCESGLISSHFYFRNTGPSQLLRSMDWKYHSLHLAYVNTSQHSSSYFPKALHIFRSNRYGEWKRPILRTRSTFRQMWFESYKAALASHGSSRGMVCYTDLCVFYGRYEVRFPVGAINISFLQNSQTDSGAQSSSCSISTGVFCGSKVAGAW
jgi:hypothetical protein